MVSAAEAVARPSGSSQSLLAPEQDNSEKPRAGTDALDGKIVSEVKFNGLRRVEPDAVKAVIHEKEGAVLSRDMVANDVRAIFGMGYFADAKVEAEPREDNKVVLTYTLTEKPAIRKVSVEGNDELGTDDMKDLLDLKAYSILKISDVRRNVRKIHDKYIEKGFYLADVNYAVEPVAGQNEVDVVFKIQEHAKVQVRRIQFVGNFKVPSADLAQVMETKTGGWLSFLTSSGNYREEMLEHDVAMVQGVYYDRGFINVRVKKPHVDLSPDKRFIYITVPIDEGEQYRVGVIDFSGDLLEPRETLHKKVISREGELFCRSKLVKDRAMMDDLAQDQGYAYANVSPLTAVHEENKTVDVTFDTQKGKPVYIERIEISGNTKTRDKVIRRELRIYEGELYSGVALKLSKQRVQALGYFETVDLATKKGSTDDLINVTLTVKERPTGTFQVGAGFSTLENFIFTAQLSQNNLFGWGQVGSLSLQLSSLRQFVQLQFVDPYFLDSKVTFSASLFRTQLAFPNYVKGQTGATVSLGYPISEFTRGSAAIPKSVTSWLEDARLYLTYTLEDVGVQPPTAGGQFSEVVNNAFLAYVVSSLQLSVTVDKRNDRLYPSNGYMLNQSVEFAPSFLGSGYQYARLAGYVKFYHPLFLGLVFKTQWNYGLIESLDGSTIPVSERYFVGGINSVRGYYLLSVSPSHPVGQRAPDSVTTPYEYGGTKQIIINNEIEFPIIEKIGIRGVAFYDMGDVYDETENFFQDKQNTTWLGMLHSVGFGLRWLSPIGPLRFEWGFPLTRRPQDGPYDFEFTIGNFF